MKAIEQYFPVVLFIMLCELVQTFESVDEILKCDHSKESYCAILSCGAICYAVQGGSNFRDCQLKLVESTSLWYCFCFCFFNSQFEVFKGAYINAKFIFRYHSSNNGLVLLPKTMLLH